MKALIIYDSVFGNTGKIAQAIGDALSREGQTETLPVSQVTEEKLQGVTLLIAGSPTRSFRPTEGLAKFLNALPKNKLAGVQVAAFDTRLALDTIDSSVLRFIVDKGGYAASAIATVLKKKGGNLVGSPEGFYVTGEEGPLKDGELERAAGWAKRFI